MIKPEERCCENCGWSQYKLGMIMVMGNNGEPTVEEGKVLDCECEQSGMGGHCEGIDETGICPYWTDKDMTNPYNSFEADMTRIAEFWKEQREAEIKRQGINNTMGNASWVARHDKIVDNLERLYNS